MKKTLILMAMLSLVSCAGAGVKPKDDNLKRRVLELQRQTFTKLIAGKGSN